MRTIAERLDRLSIPEPNSGCTLWIGTQLPEGYGLMHVTPKSSPQMAHRVAYETFVGPIPDGLQIDHLCRNPPCINPRHLEPVTRAENARRTRGSARKKRGERPGMDERTAARFLERLWQIQANAGITNAALARAIQCHPSYIRHLRSGNRKRPSMNFVHAASRRFPELIAFLLPSELTGGNNAVPTGTDEEVSP